MQAIGIIVQNPNSMCSTGVPAPNGAHLAGRPQEARQTGRVDLRDDGSISGAAPLTPWKTGHINPCWGDTHQVGGLPVKAEHQEGRA